MAEIIVVGHTESADEGGVKTTLQVVLEGRTWFIAIPAAAIPNRIALYALDTEAEAIEAILREHATRILNLPADSHADERIARLGGLRQDVTIRQGIEADLPPVPPKEPSAKDNLAAAVKSAKNVEDLRAALLEFAKAV